MITIFFGNKTKIIKAMTDESLKDAYFYLLQNNEEKGKKLSDLIDKFGLDTVDLLKKEGVIADGYINARSEIIYKLTENGVLIARNEYRRLSREKK